MNLPGRDDDLLAVVRVNGEAVPWALGVLTGAATVAAGYLSFVVLVATTGTIDVGQSITAIGRSVGFAFYNAHNIPTLTRQQQTVEQDGEVLGTAISETWHNDVTGWQRVHEQLVVDGNVVQESSQTLVEQSTTTLPPIVYLAVPVVVILVCSGLFAYSLVDHSHVESPVDVALTSLAVAAAFTLGYILIVLVGTYALTVQGTTEGTFLRPARLEALGYGVVYPFVTASVSAGFVTGMWGTASDEESG